MPAESKCAKQIVFSSKKNVFAFAWIILTSTNELYERILHLKQPPVTKLFFAKKVTFAWLILKISTSE